MKSYSEVTDAMVEQFQEPDIQSSDSEEDSSSDDNSDEDNSDEDKGDEDKDDSDKETGEENPNLVYDECDVKTSSEEDGEKLEIPADETKDETSKGLWNWN